MQSLELPQVSSLLSISIAPAISNPRRWLKRYVAPTGLAALLGLTASGLLTQAIAPSAVHAYTGTVNVTIGIQPNETYETLLRRAEAIARAATQRSFDRDILVTDVSIMIIVEGTSTVPVLSLNTTRLQWRSQPDARRWATYYSTAKALLGLNQTPAVVTTQPTVTTSTPAVTSTTPQPRSTAPNTPTAPTAAPTGAAPATQAPPPATPNPILPQRIPIPAGIGK